MIQTSSSPLRVGIAGLGTVGGGTWTVLQRNAELIARRAGRPIEVVAVADLDLDKARALTAGRCQIYSDALSMLQQAQLDVVVELIGGYGFARTLVQAALEAGVHVVTANKALLAVHGNELFELAYQKGVSLQFEAAVAGGIPIIKALREGLTANRIESVVGIVNGTTNFILTEMRERGLSFADVLKEAQALGYAEADPTFDVEGVDAAHKLVLMAAIAFGGPIRFDQASVEGISRLEGQDIRYAERLGFRVKLLAITRQRQEGVELRVHPTLIPERHLLANVNGAMNAVMVQGDAVGQTLFYGKGAGSEPTASAVVADLVDLARASAEPHRQSASHGLGCVPNGQTPPAILPMADTQSGYYLRLRVKDEPGVLADLTRVLADTGISIDAVVQPEQSGRQPEVDVILVTHPCQERQIRLAMGMLSALPAVAQDPVMLRVEFLA